MQRGDKSQEYRLLAQLRLKDASGYFSFVRYGRILARRRKRLIAGERNHCVGRYAAIALSSWQPGFKAMAGKVVIQSPAHRVVVSGIGPFFDAESY